MRYDFDEVIDRKGTNSIKWEFTSFDIEGSTDDTLPLWIADMDFKCAEPILDAIHKRVDRHIFGYSVAASKEYFQAVCGWFERRFDWKIDSNNIVTSPGIVPALAFLIRVLTSEGDGIIIQSPVYYPFTNMIKNNNRTIVYNSLINNEGYYNIDFKDLEEKAKESNNKLMILCSPHNPVGRVWNEEELMRIAEICLKNEVFLISDEIHCDLIRKNSNFVPAGKIIDSDRLISCTAPSKSFNIAGLQMSNIVIKSAEIKKLWNREIADKTGLSYTNPLGIVAAEAAYNEGEDWLEHVIDYIDDNLQYVDNYLKEHMPKAKYIIPEGTYFAWVDLNGYGYNHEELRELMVKKAGVALDEGYIFGKEGAGFERINVACPRSILQKCLDRMSGVLEKRTV